MASEEEFPSQFPSLWEAKDIELYKAFRSHIGDFLMNLNDEEIKVSVLLSTLYDYSLVIFSICEIPKDVFMDHMKIRSEEHTSELQSH